MQRSLGGALAMNLGLRLDWDRELYWHQVCPYTENVYVECEYPVCMDTVFIDSSDLYRKSEMEGLDQLVVRVTCHAIALCSTILTESTPFLLRIHPPSSTQ